MILGFTHFDPLKGEPPYTFLELGGDIIVRARQLLEGRSKKELKEATKLLNWMLEQSPAKQEIWDSLISEAEAIDDGKGLEGAPKRDLDAKTYSLLRCTDKFDLSDYPNLPSMTWPQLFAVLALTLINVSCEEEHYYGSWEEHENDPGWLHEWRIHTHSSYWLVQAMDAVATAEGLQRVTSQGVEAKKKISLRNRQAAIQKHAKTNDALLALKEFYLGGHHISMRNAAQLFCERFPDLVAHLAHYNQVRTLSEGLSKLLKNKRTSLITN
jgi:hypothetical protein